MLNIIAGRYFVYTILISVLRYRFRENHVNIPSLEELGEWETVLETLPVTVPETFAKYLFADLTPDERLEMAALIARQRRLEDSPNTKRALFQEIRDNSQRHDNQFSVSIDLCSVIGLVIFVAVATNLIQFFVTHYWIINCDDPSA